jgi:hypothetical protein
MVEVPNRPEYPSELSNKALEVMEAFKIAEVDAAKGA